MANILTGQAPERAQIDNVQIVAVASGAVYELAIGSGKVSYTAGGGDTIENVRDALYNAVSSSTKPKQFVGIEASTSSTDVLLLTRSSTASDRQRPLGVSVRTRYGGGAIQSTTQAASGPQWISLAENWSRNALPEDGEEVVIENHWGDLLYGLDALADVAPSLLVIRGLRGSLGLTAKNTGGYAEHLPIDWKIKPVNCEIGYPGGATSESGHMRLDFVNAATSLRVNATGVATETGREALHVKGTAIADVVAMRGSLGICTGYSDVGEVTGTFVLNSLAPTAGASGLFCRTGPGLTISGDLPMAAGSLLWELHAPPDNPIAKFANARVVGRGFLPTLQLDVTGDVPIA